MEANGDCAMHDFQEAFDKYKATTGFKFIVKQIDCQTHITRIDTEYRILVLAEFDVIKGAPTNDVIDEFSAVVTELATQYMGQAQVSVNNANYRMDIEADLTVFL